MYIVQYKKGDTFFNIYSKSKKRIRSYIIGLIRDDVSFDFLRTNDSMICKSLLPREGIFYVSRSLDLEI